MKRAMKDLDKDRQLEKEAEGPRRSSHTRYEHRASVADLRRAGNQTIQGILRKVLPRSKENVSAPGDSHEREADQLAEQALSPTTSPGARRETAGPSPAPRPDPGDVSHALNSSPGHPLDFSTRKLMENRLGWDFGEVRVHTSDQAAQSARQLDAQAYTVGKDIVFGAGQYAPQTTEGSRLLAHELAHVVQQSRSGTTSGGPIQRQKSANQALTEAVGVPAVMQSLSFHATLGAGQVLTSDADKTVHTVSDTRVEIYVTSSRMTVDFAPELVITSNDWPHPNIWLEQVSFDFTTGTFRWRANMRGITWLFGGGGKLTSGLAALFGSLPAAMRTPGYDPFADPNLQSNVAAFAAGLSSGGGGGGAIPTASGVGMSAEFTLGGEIRRSSGRFSLVIPSGTRVGVDISLQGGIPGSLREVRVGRIHTNLYHPTGSGANIEVRIMDTGLPAVFLESATFSAGGRLQFGYTLATEALEGLFRLLVAAEAVREGRGGELGESALDYRQPRAHAVIDALVRQNLEPMLRELILSNRRAIPGMDLGEALGFGPEMGDFPTVLPAGPGSAYG